MVRNEIDKQIAWSNQVSQPGFRMEEGAQYWWEHQDDGSKSHSGSLFRVRQPVEVLEGLRIFCKAGSANPTAWDELVRVRTSMGEEPPGVRVRDLAPYEPEDLDSMSISVGESYLWEPKDERFNLLHDGPQVVKVHEILLALADEWVPCARVRLRAADGNTIAPLAELRPAAGAK